MVQVRFINDTTPIEVTSETQETQIDVRSETQVQNIGLKSSAHHDDLTGRNLPDQHPISAITGLREALDESDTKIQTEREERIAADADLQEQIDNIDVTDETFVYEQGIASDVWVITHNLNKHPSITLVDSAGTVFKAKEEYNSANQVTVYLNGATTGKAYLN